MRYSIRHIKIWSAFKFGGAIGGILFFFLGLAMGLTTRLLVHTLRTWLESWFSLEILGHSFTLLEPLRLNDFLALLQKWDSRSWFLVLFLVFLNMLGGSLIIGLLSALSAIIYNVIATVSGGLVVQAEVLHDVGAVASFPPPTPAPPFGSPVSGDSFRPMVSTASAPPSRGGEAAGWLVAQATQQRWPINMGETRIGSGPNNQIVLGGLAINHAAIRWENGLFILYDYSGGQTWVNNHSLVGPNMLKPGFQIRLANQEFLFQA